MHLTRVEVESRVRDCSSVSNSFVLDGDIEPAEILKNNKE